MNWSHLKPREKIALIVLGAAALFGIYMRFVQRPAMQKIATYRSQIHGSEMQLKDLETKMPQDALISSTIESVKKETQDLQKRIAATEVNMPSQFNTSQLVGAVTSLANEIKLESVKQRIEKEQAYSRIYLDIKFYSTYLDAVKYLAAVEAISPFMRVEEMEILEPVGKTVELGGAPVKLVVSCLLGDAPPTSTLKKGEVKTIELKRDVLSSTSKPTEELSDTEFFLEGITYDLRNPTAIVNGDVYQTGSELGPYKVKKILADSVILTDGVEDHTLSLKATEAIKR